MEESTSKEKILKSVREALITKTDQPYPKLDYEKPVFSQLEDSPDINFAKELKKTGGNFIYCENEKKQRHFAFSFNHIANIPSFLSCFNWDKGRQE